MAGKDKEILDNIAKGRDNEALAALYKISLPKIKKLILSNNGTEEDVKDIFQDTIVVFYRQVKSGKYKSELDIDGFLYSVARNLYFKHFTRHVRKNVLVASVAEDNESEDFLQQIIGEEKRMLIKKIFNELGPTCGELLKLTTFNGYNLKQIAEEMGFSNEGVAKTKSYKCRQRLIKLVQEHNLINFLKS